MDLLMWTKSNPVVEINETRKLFYSKYPFKVRLTVNGAGAVTSRHEVDQYLVHRSNQKNYNPMGHWSSYKYTYRMPDSDETSILKYIRKAKEDHPEIKMRVEGSNIDLYHDDEKHLYSLLTKSIDCTKFVVAVWRPNEEYLQEILSGKQIVQSSNFKYKIICREGKIPQNEKQGVLDYLQSLNSSEVKMTKSFVDQMEKPYMLYGCYFYLNDLQYLTILKIMSPYLVRNYIELVPSGQ